VAAARQEPQRLVVDGRRFQRRPQRRVRLRPVGVRLHHERVLGAHPELQQPVLEGLEAGGSAERLPEGQVVVRRHRGQDVPGLDELALDAADPRGGLEGRAQLVAAQAPHRQIHLVQHQLEPQLLHLVDDDEQRLVVLAGQRPLRGQIWSSPR
jgi:hypothetical protein